MPLNRKIALTLFLITLSISMSFVAAAACTPNMFANFGDIQKVDGLHKIAVAVPFVLGAGLNGNSTSILDQPTRLEIYNFIKNNPGIHFRGICDRLSLSVGVVQYHLDVLERAGIITCQVDGQNKRFFENGAFAKADMTLISLVKHETTAKILKILLQNGSTFHKDIARDLGVSSQALTWQMNQLKKIGLINAEKTGINVKYSLSDAHTIKFILNLTTNSQLL